MNSTSASRNRSEHSSFRNSGKTSDITKIFWRHGDLRYFNSEAHLYCFLCRTFEPPSHFFECPRLFSGRKFRDHSQIYQISRRRSLRLNAWRPAGMANIFGGGRL